MKQVTPRVYLVAEPHIRIDEMRQYLEQRGGLAWADRRIGESDEAAVLVEMAGRLCYRSWAPGLNANVSRIRKSPRAYIENILAQGHGSVLEHASYSFVFADVSRVFTHELVRHRVGTAVSQESLRYVRTAEEIGMWVPSLGDSAPLAEAMEILTAYVSTLRDDLVDQYGLDDDHASFDRKKEVTSALRRLLPQGMATDVLWSANVRTLRHVIVQRTSAGAEAEMRHVFGIVAEIMRETCPLMFGDLELRDGAWISPYGRV